MWPLRLILSFLCALSEVCARQKDDYDYEHRSLHSLSTSTIGNLVSGTIYELLFPLPGCIDVGKAAKGFLVRINKIRKIGTRR